MPIQFGRVIKFNPNPGFCWGFARIEGTAVDVFIHKNQKHQVEWTGPEADDTAFRRDAPCILNVGDKLVFDVRQDAQGRAKAIAWAFRREWEVACRVAPVTRPAEAPPTPSPEPVIPAPPAPKADPPLTFGEMLAVLDFRFLHAVLDALEKEELTPALLQLFVRNTPNRKRGKTVWDEFHKRQTHSRDKKYGVAAFIRDVLADAGFIIKE